MHNYNRRHRGFGGCSSCNRPFYGPYYGQRPYYGPGSYYDPYYWY